MTRSPSRSRSLIRRSETPPKLRGHPSCTLDATTIVALPCFDQTVAFRRSGDPRDREDPMKAIVQERYGAADVLKLEDIDRPELGDDEVLVRVLAASAHIGDWHFMTGLPYLFRIA